MRKTVWTIVLFVIGAVVFGFAVGHALQQQRLMPSRRFPQRADGAVLFRPMNNENAFYDRAYDAAQDFPSADVGRVRAAIVNHHLLAPHFIADVMGYVGAASPSVIVLVSPNHFSVGSSDAISTTGAWQTAYGVLRPDAALVTALEKTGLVTVEDKPFDTEHGIANITPFLKRSAPAARFVPLILRDRMKVGDIEALAGQLRSLLPSDAMIVLSVDFSHNLPPGGARFHDEKTLRLLRAADASGLSSLDADSEPAIRLLLSFLGPSRFAVLHHTDSAAVVGKDLDDTTSYIDGVFVEGVPERVKGADILLFGDVPTGTVFGSADRVGSGLSFAPMRRLFRGNDAVFAVNAEGTSKVMEAGGMKVAFVAPSGSMAADADEIARFRGCHSRFMRESRPSVWSTGLPHDCASAVARNDNAEAVDYVVVAADWEDDPGTLQARQRLARAWIDAGADFVFGSGSGAPTPVELYKGKPILFSVGTLVSDEARANAVALAVGAHFSPEGMTFFLLPTQVVGDAASFLPSSARAKLFADLAGGTDLPTMVVDGIRRGQFTIEKRR